MPPRKVSTIRFIRQRNADGHNQTTIVGTTAIRPKPAHNLLNIRNYQKHASTYSRNLFPAEDALADGEEFRILHPSFRLGESGHGVRDLFFNTGFRPDYRFCKFGAFPEKITFLSAGK